MIFNNLPIYIIPGIIPLSFKGVLDMPSRIGEITYDWGDEIQPLVNDGDIFWGDISLSMEAFYDGRQTESKVLELYENIKHFANEFEIIADHWHAVVKLSAFNFAETYNDYQAKVVFVFNINEPVLTDVSLSDLPQGLVYGSNEVLIDGYGFFKVFGIIVSKVSNNNDIGDLKKSNNTYFNKSEPLGCYRNLETIELTCSKVYSSKEELIVSISKLKLLLSLPGYRIIKHKNRTYKTFLSEGFNVVVKKNHIQFVLKLNIIYNDTI